VGRKQRDPERLAAFAIAVRRASAPESAKSRALGSRSSRGPTVFPVGFRAAERTRVFRIEAHDYHRVAAVALFGVGYLVGARPDARVERTIAMSGAGGASAELDVFEQDEAGNWPMELRVGGLTAGSYELWLTRDGKLAETCGRFAVAGPEPETAVPLNAPYKLRQFDGWIVVPVGGEEAVLTT
jgi:hypothetical protein